MRFRASPGTRKTTFSSAHICAGANRVRLHGRDKNLQTRFSLERSLARTCESTRSPERSPRASGALSGRLSDGRKPTPQAAHPQFTATAQPRSEPGRTPGHAAATGVPALDHSPAAGRAALPHTWSPRSHPGPPMKPPKRTLFELHKVQGETKNNSAHPGEVARTRAGGVLRPRRGLSVVDVTRR